MSRVVLGSCWVVLGAGCASGTQDTGALPAPTITLITPAEGAVVCGEPLALEVLVTDYVLVGFDQPESSVPGVGHVDIKLNGQNRWMTDDTVFEIPQVDDGVYWIEALLVDGEHHALAPSVSDAAEVTVDDEACAADSGG